MLDNHTFLIDGSIYVFRAYFGLPDQWHDKQGRSINAVWGFTRVLIQLLAQQKPKQIAIAFDESLGTDFRQSLYSEYKISRTLPDDELAYQLACCEQAAHALGIATVKHHHYEADDLLASLAHQYEHDGVAIISGDKDLAQIIQTDNDVWWDYGKKPPMNREQYADKNQIQVAQLPDYLALVGDSVDDIPGVPSIGKKTASVLLAHFPSIETMYQHLDDIEQLPLRGKQRIVDNLKAHCEQALLMKLLARLVKDIDLSEQITQETLQYSTEEIDIDWFNAMNLGGFIPQLTRLKNG